jgi:hypothetical protein
MPPVFRDQGRPFIKTLFGGKAMDKEENREHLEMIRKALDLIDDRAFEILNGVEIESARGWALQFRRAHDELGDMVNHLADLAGIKEEEGDD